MRIYLVVNKVFVGPNQNIICKYVAREIGNIHSSCGSDSGAISLSHSWDLVARRGGETFWVVCGQGSLGREVGMGHLEHRR